MESVGLAKIEKGEPERNLKFAYVISRWLGVFAYLTAVWIGGFSTVSIGATLYFSRPIDINFVLNGLVTFLTFGTGLFGIIVLLKGNLHLERVIIYPVIIGLSTSTIIYIWKNFNEIFSGVELSALAGLSGAIITGLVMYLVIRFGWIADTIKLAKENRNVIERIEALEA